MEMSEIIVTIRGSGRDQKLNTFHDGHGDSNEMQKVREVASALNEANFAFDNSSDPEGKAKASEKLRDAVHLLEEQNKNKGWTSDKNQKVINSFVNIISKKAQ